MFHNPNKQNFDRNSVWQIKHQLLHFTPHHAIALRFIEHFWEVLYQVNDACFQLELLHIHHYEINQSQTNPDNFEIWVL